jgi:hypothetical protein
MRKFIIIDDTKFPIVISRCQKFIPTPEEFRQMQVDLETYASNHQDYVSIFDLTDLAFLSSEFRISQAKWSKRNDPMFVKQNIRFAFCTPSSIAQIMLKGVFLINKPGVPYTVVSSVEQGIAWGVKQMQS